LLHQGKGQGQAGVAPVHLQGRPQGQQPEDQARKCPEAGRRPPAPGQGPGGRQAKDGVGGIDLLPHAAVEGQPLAQAAEQGVQRRGQQESQEIGREDVGKTATLAPDVALGAQVGQHGRQLGEHPHQED